jgi:hypothetical protein
MANIAAQAASQGLTGPQLMQQAVLGGSGIIAPAAQQAQILAQQQLANQGITPLGQGAAAAAENADMQTAQVANTGGAMSNVANSGLLAGGNPYADDPANNITAGMAVGDAPIATAGNFNPQTQFAAARIFGPQKFKRKPLINL